MKSRPLASDQAISAYIRPCDQFKDCKSDRAQRDALANYPWIGQLSENFAALMSQLLLFFVEADHVVDHDGAGDAFERQLTRRLNGHDVFDC
jgi:hypothetical protein